MNKNVKLLDCTLRDGGFINDWNFSHCVINNIFNRLASAGIDIIEMGFIDGRRETDINRSIFPSTEAMKIIFDGIDAKSSQKVAMIDYGTCSIENIQKCEQSILDGIRVIFKKKDIDGALEFCGLLKKKGYQVYVQPVSVTTYTDMEILDMVQKVNRLNPCAFSIVDTYGLMQRSELVKFFYLIDNNLNTEISIGFHSHNNFQLAYSNSISLLSLETERSLIVDGTCYGMGKTAGNANTELLAMFLNQYCSKGYVLDEILEAIDVNIKPIRQRYEWGYSFDYFLSASNNVHPQYVNYLLSLRLLSVKSINCLLSMIENEKKLSYDQSYIEELYRKFQQHVKIDDAKAVNKLRAAIERKCVLVLAPGKSLEREADKIEGFLNENRPVIFTVNFYTESFPVDYVFISNAKRYTQLHDKKKQLAHTDIILTSNITEETIKGDYVVNYHELRGSDNSNVVSSAVLIFRLFERMGIKEVYVAGADGFLVNGEENYLESGYYLDAKMNNSEQINEIIADAIKKIDLNVHYITRSTYE